MVQHIVLTVDQSEQADRVVRVWSTRLYNGVLSSFEQRLIAWFLPRIPQGVTPNLLSLLAIFGAVLCAGSLVACWLSALFLAPAALGLFLHWLGDSLDGALARYRKRERPRAGFLIDRGSDVLTFFILLLGMGCSPFLTPFAAVCVFVMTLLTMTNSLLINVTRNSQVLGFCGLGGTEGRILGFIWIGIIHFSGSALSSFNLAFYPYWDLAAFGGLVILLAKLGFDIWKLIEQNGTDEAKAWDLHSANTNVASLPVSRLHSPVLVMVDHSAMRAPIPARSVQEVIRQRRKS